MPINYPSPETYNPLGQLQQGIATGLAIGRRNQSKQTQQTQQGSPSDAIIPDPGEKQYVDLSKMLDMETKDLLTYEAYNKKMKKLDPESKKKVIQNLANSTSINSPIVKELMQNDEFINPEEISKIIQSIKNNSPTARADVQLLIELSGGENSKGGKAILNKIQEASSMQAEYDEQRKIMLKGTVLNIEQYIDNPKQYQGKSGVSNQETLNVVKKYPEYMKELAQYDPEWVRKHLEGVQSKRAGGYKPRQVEFSGYTKDKRRVIGTFSRAQDFLRAHPEVVPGTVRQSERETFMHEATGGGLNVNQQINKGGSKKLTAEKAREFLNQAGGDKDKARKMAKEQGYEF